MLRRMSVSGVNQKPRANNCCCRSAIRGAGAKSNSDASKHAYCIVAGVARCIISRAPDQGIVAQTAIEDVVATPSVERVVLLVADDCIGARGPGNVFDTNQGIDRYLDESLPARRRDNLGFSPSALSAVEAKMNDNKIGAVDVIAKKTKVEDMIRRIICRINSALAVKDVVAETAYEHVVKRVASQMVSKPGTDQSFDRRECITGRVSAGWIAVCVSSASLTVTAAGEDS